MTPDWSRHTLDCANFRTITALKRVLTQDGERRISRMTVCSGNDTIAIDFNQIRTHV